MENAKAANFATLLDDIGAAGKRVWSGLGRAIRFIAVQPWPVLLLAAILLAFAITIVPLVLFLFIGFLVLKLAVATMVIESRRHRGD
jgi:hypothetical protein